MALAEATERGEGPQRYAGCRAFRAKLGDEIILQRDRKSFCASSPATPMPSSAGLSHKNRITILRPSVKALTAMFTRLARKVCPSASSPYSTRSCAPWTACATWSVSSKDLLNDDRVLLEEIDKLEALMKSLRGKATEFVEL